MQLSLFSQGILSILMVIIVSITIGVSYQDTLVIILISGLVIFLLNLCRVYYTSYHNKKMNNKHKFLNSLLQRQKNNLVNKSHLDTISQPIINTPPELPQEPIKLNNETSEEIIPEKKPYHLTNTPDAIMEAETYNLEDCTTDKTCIQGADDNNLFPGFDKEDKFVPPTEVKVIVNDRVENNSLKKDNLVVENFANCPLELTDVVKPFNNAVINPYKNFTMEEELDYQENKYLSSQDIDEDLCFHCKIGHCEGGVCRDINELKSDELENIVTEINSMKRIHPFSKNFPTVLATNPDARY